jgi:hypothetical protein
VSQEDLRFPPAKRRERTKFEPPPWERAQFEELAKAREEQEPAEKPASEEPVSSAQATAAEEIASAVREAEKVHAAPTAAAGEGDGEKAGPAIDPKRLEVMLMGLRAEEPRPEEAYWVSTTAAGVVSALIGLALTTWGILAFVKLSRSGLPGLVMASVLTLFGLGFTGGGVWLVQRTLRQRGVL